MIADLRGERIFVDSGRGLTVAQARELLDVLPGLIREAEMTEEERLLLSFEREPDSAKTRMLRQTHKDLYTPAPAHDGVYYQKHESPLSRPGETRQSLDKGVPEGVP